ncbi:hypothetical protein N9C35_03325 [Flavobacteriaceae bacterium]|nr:hypothetical protein [Flavobacteriaceae bacterium]
MKKTKIIAQIVLTTSLWGSSVFAATTSEIKSLRNEFNNIKNSYDKKISDLENKSILNNTNSTRTIYDNKFNPSIGVILNGKFSSFSKKDSEFAGFAVGEEGERGKEGVSIGESEVNFSSNIDDKFFGSLTAAIVNEEGSDKVELEEAFIRTTPGFGLPTGLEVKAGRAFWNLGYLNSHHAHTDDFADRPLPYRAFLNKAFNDDGAEISYILPTDLYAEIGGGSYRGDDFPFGGGDGTGQYSSYARIGGDIGSNQSWRFGFSSLIGEAETGRVTNESNITFIGDSDLYIADLRYVFAPTGNSKNQELILQGEYFHRDESGTYDITTPASGAINFNDESSGWYAQTIYKFKPEWRFGLRYSELLSPKTPTGLIGTDLDSNNHDPKSYTAMLDWTNSEFSRIRLQYDHERLSQNNNDNKFTLQYIMSFGAHSAHRY